MNKFSQQSYVELRGKQIELLPQRSCIFKLICGFKLELLHNDVAVTLYYKDGNKPWQSLLINNVFSEDNIPQECDVYLLANLTLKQRVIFNIWY